MKWWLLVIPHYLIVASFRGSELGLIFIATIIAAVVLLFTGKYPKDIFKLIVGMNRWAYRVSAYAMLMTDRYPPFRLWDD